MSNVLETELHVKSKRLERISGSIPSKARLTSRTFASLKLNRDNGLISKKIEKYNAAYDELHDAVVSAEIAAAEQKVRDNALKSPGAIREEEQRNAKMAEDNLVAKITSVEVAKPRLSKLKISVQKLKGHFGTLGKNFGVNVLESYNPKALSVPSIYSKTYKVILKNTDLYKFASKISEISSDSELSQQQNNASSLANWRSLFDGYNADRTDEINVALDSTDNFDDEEFVPIESKGVSQEELSHRKMIGQLGEELEEVRKLQVSSNGLASPFNDGLAEREDNLLSMLSNLSGVEEISRRKERAAVKSDNTEFQNLIEHIVGYKEPISEEEHKEKERSMQEYYSDPEVSEIIDTLRHKDVLFSFNQPDAYNKVMSAERLDNDRIASESTAIDILDSDEDEKDDNIIIQDEPLISNVHENQVNTDYENIMSGAEEQAKMLSKEIERQNIIFGAEEQAKLIMQQNERIDLLNGADEQARMLKTLYDFIDMQEEKEKSSQQKSVDVAETSENVFTSSNLTKGAEEQAQELQRRNERVDLINGAEEQAQELQRRNERVDLINGAEEQAQELQRRNERVDLINGAEEQAQELQRRNERVDLINDAEEQAQELQRRNEKIDLINDAEEQAQELQRRNERVDLINGAEEQAHQLQASNDYLQIVSSAVEQAKNIQKNNEKIDLINGAEEQARILNSVPEEADVMEKLAAQIVYQSTADESIVEGAKEQAELLQAQKSVKDGHLQNSVDQSSLKEDAFVQAQELQKKNETADLVNGAENQARLLMGKYSNKSDSIFEKMKLSIVDTYDRYASVFNPSKPIRLRAEQRDNMLRRLSKTIKSDFTRKKEALISLKEQLSSSDLDFLKYSDSVIGNVKA